MAAGEQTPETKYARVGEDRIAYQVFGEGGIDLLYLPAMADCIDMRWQWPPYARFLHHLGGLSRVIMFDRRGQGASEVPSGDALPSWEQLADDVRAVLDAVASESAVIWPKRMQVMRSSSRPATRHERGA
jgi:pimeloyl-ACP methyl ester carboxylesterase